MGSRREEDAPDSERKLGRLCASIDASAADWIVAGVRDFDGTVGSIVPAVFEAYARVFHPAGLRTDTGWADVGWSDVAEANGRVMHPAAEWGSLVGSWKVKGQPELWEAAPSQGEPPDSITERLAALLADYTETPSRCWFAVWEGWGSWSNTSESSVFFPDDTPEDGRQRARESHRAKRAARQGLIKNAAPFELPQRPMRLLNAPLAAVGDLHEYLCHAPSVWWPQDRAWCIGTDVDLVTTYVGGASAAIDALLADNQLEVLQVGDDQSVTWEADTINPLPAPPY